MHYTTVNILLPSPAPIGTRHITAANESTKPFRRYPKNHILKFLLFSLALHTLFVYSWQSPGPAPASQPRDLSISLSSTPSVLPAPLTPSSKPGAGTAHPAMASQDSSPSAHQRHDTEAATFTALNKSSETESPAPVQEEHAGPLPSPATAATADVGANDIPAITQTITAQLRRALAAHFTYPELARRHNWQGRVEISLRVSPDGRLFDIHLIQSSGHKLLDLDALRTLREIAYIPLAAHWPRDRYFDIVLPIDYLLTNS